MLFIFATPIYIPKAINTTCSVWMQLNVYAFWANHFLLDDQLCALPWRRFPAHVSPTIVAIVQVKFGQSCWWVCTSAASNIHRKNSQWMPSLETLKFWKKNMTSPYLKINKGIFEMRRSIISLVFLLNKSVHIDNKIKLKLCYMCEIISRQRKIKWAILIACQLMCQFVDG